MKWDIRVKLTTKIVNETKRLEILFKNYLVEISSTEISSVEEYTIS
jgi:hypothetical protein